LTASDKTIKILTWRNPRGMTAYRISGRYNRDYAYPLRPSGRRAVPRSTRRRRSMFSGVRPGPVTVSSTAERGIREQRIAEEGDAVKDPERSSDLEEARLVSILAACTAKVAAAIQPISHPTRSMLMSECWKLEKDLKMARAERAKAIAALTEYRERRRGQAADNSK
jgi:hypothetical protein